MRLRALGHTAYTPTLTGLGERSHLVSPSTNLKTWLKDIAQVIEFEELEDVILVGHSFGGAVVSGLADLMPERLRHLVYFDAMVLQSGQGALDTAPPDLIERYRRQAAETSGGLTIPPNDPSYYGVTEPNLAAWLKTKLTPHPLQTYLDRLELDNPVGNGRPVTYITCTEPFNRSTASSREFASSKADWTYVEFPSNHNAMLSAPDALTKLLSEIG